MDGYGKLFEDIKAGNIISAYAVEGNGAVEAVSKMAFGNHLGSRSSITWIPEISFLPDGAILSARFRTDG